MKGRQLIPKPGKATVWSRRFLLVVALYFASYGILSSKGEYVPAAWGAGWVKWYKWAPAGFVSGEAGTRYTKVNVALNLFFYPLLMADRKLIHTRDEGRSGRYPANYVLDRALGESYGEWYREADSSDGIDEQPGQSNPDASER